MVDVGAVVALTAPFGIGAHPHRGHPQRRRRFQVAGDVLDHDRRPWVNPVALDKLGIYGGVGLGLEPRIGDVEDGVEVVFYAKAPHHPPCVAGRGVGEDQLAPG